MVEGDGEVHQGANAWVGDLYIAMGTARFCCLLLGANDELASSTVPVSRVGLGGGMPINVSAVALSLTTGTTGNRYTDGSRLDKRTESAEEHATACEWLAWPG